MPFKMFPANIHKEKKGEGEIKERERERERGGKDKKTWMSCSTRTFVEEYSNYSNSEHGRCLSGQTFPECLVCSLVILVIGHFSRTISIKFEYCIKFMIKPSIDFHYLNSK